VIHGLRVLRNTVRSLSSVERGMLLVSGIYEYVWLSVYDFGGREVNLS